MPDGTLYFEQTYFPLAESDDDGIPRGRLQRMHVDRGCGSRPALSIRRRSARGPGVFARARTGPSSACSAATSSRRASSSTGPTTSSCFWRLTLRGPIAFLIGWWKSTWPTLKDFSAAVGSSIDIILFGDDLGMQTGPMLSPRMYCEFFKPRHQILWNRAKELADVKVMLHCCGGVRELLPHLIEAGLDAINPVQITCCGMDAAELKAEFGRDLTFWGGGCDTQEILTSARPEQVAEHVRSQVRILSPGGGFVFQQVHNILANVPPENIVAMFDAVNPRR